MKTIQLFFFLLLFTSTQPLTAQSWSEERDFLKFKIDPTGESDSLYKAVGDYKSMTDYVDDSTMFWRTIRLRDFKPWKAKIAGCFTTQGDIVGYADNFASSKDTANYTYNDWLALGALYFYGPTHKSKIKIKQKKAFRKAYLKVIELSKYQNVANELLIMLVAFKANGDSLYYNAIVGCFKNSSYEQEALMMLMSPQTYVKGIPYVVNDVEFDSIFTTLLASLEEDVKDKENDAKIIGLCNRLKNTKRLSDAQLAELSIVISTIADRRKSINFEKTSPQGLSVADESINQ